MKKTLLWLFLLTVCITQINAQKKISYAYDNAGNRVQRVLKLASFRSADSERVTAPQTFFQEGLANKQIKLYPNPVKSHLTIEITDDLSSVKCEFKLFNLKGQLLLSDKIKTNQTIVDMIRFPSGNYVLQILIDGEQTTWKIIKE